MEMEEISKGVLIIPIIRSDGGFNQYDSCAGPAKFSGGLVF